MATAARRVGFAPCRAALTPSPRSPVLASAAPVVASVAPAASSSGAPPAAPATPPTCSAGTSSRRWLSPRLARPRRSYQAPHQRRVRGAAQDQAHHRAHLRHGHASSSPTRVHHRPGARPTPSTRLSRRPFSFNEDVAAARAPITPTRPGPPPRDRPPRRIDRGFYRLRLPRGLLWCVQPAAAPLSAAPAPARSGLEPAFRPQNVRRADIHPPESCFPTWLRRRPSLPSLAET